MIILYGILAIIVVMLLLGVKIYNDMVRLKNQMQEAWSDIDVQYKRRFDLIPNLVETVKGYAKHENTIFTQVVELRNQANSTTSLIEKDKAEAGISLGLNKLFALAENYPDLKASANFIDLQKNLTDIEEQIQNARRYYNGVTRDYNTKIQSFPDSFVAGLFHFTQAEFLKLESDAEKQPTKVSF
ncbi:MAG: LemA family protein [Gammaproteobacteria bacterium]|nr:LemA family protein [Gammaproteobacteria bacterium]